MRERDDVIQIWNTQSDLAAEAKVIEKVKILLPDVHFLAEFYKGLLVLHNLSGIVQHILLLFDDLLPII